jgi:hypothetical protein
LDDGEIKDQAERKEECYHDRGQRSKKRETPDGEEGQMYRVQMAKCLGMPGQGLWTVIILRTTLDPTSSVVDYQRKSCVGRKKSGATEKSWEHMKVSK